MISGFSAHYAQCGKRKSEMWSRSSVPREHSTLLFLSFWSFHRSEDFLLHGEELWGQTGEVGGGGALSEEVNVLLSAHCSLVSLIWSGRGNTVKDIYLLLNLAEYFIPIYFA